MHLRRLLCASSATSSEVRSPAASTAFSPVSFLPTRDYHVDVAGIDLQTAADTTASTARPMWSQKGEAPEVPNTWITGMLPPESPFMLITAFIHTPRFGAPSALGLYWRVSLPSPARRSVFPHRTLQRRQVHSKLAREVSSSWHVSNLHIAHGPTSEGVQAPGVF